MNHCPKCNGLIITEKTVAEGEWIEIRRCLHCGEHKCPPENRELRQLNSLVYRVKERAKEFRGYNDT